VSDQGQATQGAAPPGTAQHQQFATAADAFLVFILLAFLVVLIPGKEFDQGDPAQSTATTATTGQKQFAGSSQPFVVLVFIFVLVEEVHVVEDAFVVLIPGSESAQDEPT
jgi:hypothetical protein